MRLRCVKLLLGSLPLISLVCGCADAFKSPYPAKRYFLVDPGEPTGRVQRVTAVFAPKSSGDSALAIGVPRVLKLRQLRIATPFDGSAFIYKVGPNQFSSDYYSAFLQSTDTMLTAKLRDWLRRSTAFDEVVDAASSVHARYFLEGNVSSLYGDFVNPRVPRAVVEAQFFLLEDGDGGQRILFARSYASSAPVAGEGPAALVDAWNHVCREMFGQLAADLDRNLSGVAKPNP